ncbi:AAC(3) family N-acetyltransferase [Vibrio coralliilyticus]|uniref:AAC(3) family N-acetyltransferase n=1 Tax=Vibrio coralliilyticus TaxID=190893 RepID=UPI0005128821|nr:AAC(3) family N-acetyltransferase [Vibrio coralliilyticus]AIU68108.1 hypothetical protein JV59_38500 [Vibrio coralliilyticus]
MGKGYSLEALTKAIREVGVTEGDILFCHSNVGYLGLPEGAKSKNDALAMIYSSIRSVIGDSGTLVVPTFTYSFGTQERFNVETSVSNCGMFSEYIRQLPDSYRSNDPSVSVAAVGRHADALTQVIDDNAYSDSSVFARLIEQKVRVFNINFDAGTTLLHFFERKYEVPYRFDKTFSGELYLDGDYHQATSTLWVRDLEIAGSEANFERFNEYVSEKGSYVRSIVGRGNVGSITIEDVETAFKELLAQDAWFLTNKGN